MSEKELYRQKMHAQLDEWKADLDKLKAKSAGASADAKLKIEQEHKALDARIAEGKTKLAALGDATEGEWHSLKEGIESAWATMKSAIAEAAAKFKA